ncbi:MAG TPA: peptidylprolyl isomerase [Verrucomicrobiae bacterium]
MKRIFSAALAAALLTLPRANAVTSDGMMAAATATNSSAADAATNSAATGTNANPLAAMASLFPDLAIAKGNGFEIKQSELDEVMASIKARAAAQGQTIPPEQLMQFQVMALNELIGTQLLLQKATDADKAAGKKDADTKFAKLLEQAGSQEAFNLQLKAAGITADDLRAKITQEATATAVLKRELAVTPATDSDVTNFYAANPEYFEVPETVHVRHILLLTINPLTQPTTPLPEDQIKAKRKEIDDILTQLRGGADFATLAKKYSEDPSSKDKGGELPEFPRNAQGIPTELAAAAFSLETNQISDVVTMDVGYDIVQLLTKTPAKTLKLTDKLPSSDMTVAAKIKDNLTEQKTGEVAPAYLEKLKKGADVQILDADLKAAAAKADAEAAATATDAPAAQMDGGAAPAMADTNVPAK